MLEAGVDRRILFLKEIQLEVPCGIEMVFYLTHAVSSFVFIALQDTISCAVWKGRGVHMLPLPAQAKLLPSQGS